MAYFALSGGTSLNHSRSMLPWSLTSRSRNSCNIVKQLLLYFFFFCEEYLCVDFSVMEPFEADLSSYEGFGYLVKTCTLIRSASMLFIPRSFIALETSATLAHLIAS